MQDVIAYNQAAGQHVLCSIMLFAFIIIIIIGGNELRSTRRGTDKAL
jgi:hypothetical protein